MLNRHHLLITALLTGLGTTTAIAGDRDDACCTVPVTTNVDAYDIAFQRNIGTSTAGVGDLQNGYVLDVTKGNLQCASCNVSNGFMTDFQIEDAKRFDQENRAYNYQAGTGASTASITQTMGSNLAVIGQGPSAQDAISNISQIHNNGEASKALITDNTTNSVGNIIQESSSKAMAKITLLEGSDNIVQTQQNQTDRSIVDITVSGSGNEIYSNQTGSENVTLVQMQGDMNQIQVNQEGDRNIALVESIDDMQADNSYIFVNQFGTNNQGYTRVAGDNNMVMAFQEADNDYFCSTQLTDNNQFNLQQR